jgi:hypothetical protein
VTFLETVERARARLARDYTPRHLADKILQSKSTVLFADLGATEHAVRLARKLGS